MAKRTERMFQRKDKIDKGQAHSHTAFCASWNIRALKLAGKCRTTVRIHVFFFHLSQSFNQFNARLNCQFDRFSNGKNANN